MKEYHSRKFCVAPMMGKTDSYFCYLLGLINNKTLVYTEMMHSETIIRSRILESYNIVDNKKRIAVQIAGSNPDRLALAAKKVSDYGFDEININCGCPSKRVVSGKFGINLLLEPLLVRRCVEEISKKVSKKAVNRNKIRRILQEWLLKNIKKINNHKPYWLLVNLEIGDFCNDQNKLLEEFQNLMFKSRLIK